MVGSLRRSCPAVFGRAEGTIDSFVFSGLEFWAALNRPAKRDSTKSLDSNL